MTLKNYTLVFMKGDTQTSVLLSMVGYNILFDPYNGITKWLNREGVEYLDAIVLSRDGVDVNKLDEIHEWLKNKSDNEHPIPVISDRNDEHYMNTRQSSFFHVKAQHKKPLVMFGMKVLPVTIGDTTAYRMGNTFVYHNSLIEADEYLAKELDNTRILIYGGLDDISKKVSNVRHIVMMNAVAMKSDSDSMSVTLAHDGLKLSVDRFDTGMSGVKIIKSYDETIIYRNGERIDMSHIAKHFDSIPREFIVSGVCDTDGTLYLQDVEYGDMDVGRLYTNYLSGVNYIALTDVGAIPPHSGLVRRKVQVHRQGKTYTRWQWVRPEYDEEAEEGTSADTDDRKKEKEKESEKEGAEKGVMGDEEATVPNELAAAYESLEPTLFRAANELKDKSGNMGAMASYVGTCGELMQALQQDDIDEEQVNRIIKKLYDYNEVLQLSGNEGDYTDDERSFSTIANYFISNVREDTDSELVNDIMRLIAVGVGVSKPHKYAGIKPYIRKIEWHMAIRNVVLPESIVKVLNSNDEKVIKSLLLLESDKDMALLLAYHNNPAIRYSAAVRLRSEDLKYMVYDSDNGVINDIFKYRVRELPVTTMIELLDNDLADSLLIGDAVRELSTNNLLQYKLYAHPNVQVRYEVASTIDSKYLERMADDEDNVVRLIVANRSTDEETLKRLINDESPKVRYNALAQFAKCYPEH
ncbi:MAG: hypothetical protein ACTSPB_19545, partial [Candidatus Thorarchaeota archaeon]